MLLLDDILDMLNMSCLTKFFERPFLSSAWKSFFTSFSSIKLIFPALVLSHYALSFFWIRLFSQFIHRSPVDFWVQSFHAMVPRGSEITLFAWVMLVNRIEHNAILKPFSGRKKKRLCIPLENGSKLHSSIMYVNLIMGMVELIYLVIKNMASSKMHIIIFSFVDFSWTVDVSQCTLQLHIAFWDRVNAALESNYGTNIFPWNVLCDARFYSCF